MAIAPIDLQTLFTQIDKVAKTQTSLKESGTIHQAVQNAQIMRKNEEQAHQVNQMQNTGDGAEKIKDQDQREQQHGEKRKKKSEDQEEADETTASSVLTDPSLGKNIDISL